MKEEKEVAPVLQVRVAALNSYEVPDFRSLTFPSTRDRQHCVV